MLSYGSFMFSGADELADELWRTLSQWGGLLVEKGGRWNAGTLYEEAHPIKNYITFIGSPSLVTVGYCGDENFVSRICDLTADFWPRVGAENFESAFVAFNEEPIPRFHYFEGAQQPRFVGNRIHATPLHRNWMWHISDEKLFNRKLLRNVYPINMFNGDYLSHITQLPGFSASFANLGLEILEFSSDRFGLLVEAKQQIPLFEMLSKADLIVEDEPLAPGVFVSNVRQPRRTLFPVYEFLERGRE